MRSRSSRRTSGGFTMAYAEAGVPLDGDAYEAGSWPSSLVKRAVNIILNARDRTSAWRRLAQEFRCTGAFKRAEALLDAIERRHAAIKDFFYSSAGLRFMNRDSHIVETVLRSLMKRGLIALPIHDSF